MLELVFMIGQAISAVLMAYGAYLVFDEAVSPARKKSPATDNELPADYFAPKGWPAGHFEA